MIDEEAEDHAVTAYSALILSQELFFKGLLNKDNQPPFPAINS